MIPPRVTGVVLAAGGSRRLGTPEQVLPYRHTTVLGASPDVARRCGFDRISVEGRDHPIVACRYTDSLGHPFGLHRGVVGDLMQLRGDQAIWKLVQAAHPPVHELAVDGAVPLDVDTRADYRRLVETGSGSGSR